MCSVAYLCVVSPACGNDLFVVVVCILVRKRAGPWKVVAAYQNVTSKCDNSTVCTWSKGNGRVGPRLDNLVSELEPTGGNKVTTTPVFSQEEKKTAEEAIGEGGHQSVQGSVLYKEKGL